MYARFMHILIKRVFGILMKRKLILSFASIVFVLIVYFGSARKISVSNTVNGRELPIYSVETDKKQVALSFDATWGNEYTKEILNILKKYNVKVTFFLTGDWVEKYPEDVKKILLLGHEVGNHSENHKTMSQISEEMCKQEILSVHDKVKVLTGLDMNLFRAPYGDYNDQLIKTAKSCGYEVVQWSIDSLDWKEYGAKSVIKNVLENQELKNGAIILMHNGAKDTKDALEAVVLGLKKQEYEIVPISELIYKEDYHLDVTGRQFGDKNAF